MADVVQVCFGKPGTGGPATALAKLLAGSQRSYPVVWQSRGAGGISIGLMREMAAEIRAHSPRLVHVRGLGNEGLHGVIAARMAGAKRVLLSVHGSQRDLQGPKATLRSRVVAGVLEPLSLRLADHVVTVCEFAAARDFLRPYLAKMLEPVPNGVEAAPDGLAAMRAQVRAELAIEAGRVVAVAVSRLTLDKGYGDLAAALRLLPAGPGLDLIVVGDGDPQIAALFERLPRVAVHFVGFQRDVGRYLAASDLFVFPTWSENLSNALLEAMTYGLPVVATAVGGNTEVIKKGGGVLVPSHDPQSLATALDQMISSPDLRVKLGRAAQENACTNYPIAEMVRRWESHYDRILGDMR